MDKRFRDPRLALRSALLFLGLFVLSVGVWSIAPEENSNQGLPVWAVVIAVTQVIAMGAIVVLAKWSAGESRD